MLPGSQQQHPTSSSTPKKPNKNVFKTKIILIKKSNIFIYLLILPQLLFADNMYHGTRGRGLETSKGHWPFPQYAPNNLNNLRPKQNNPLVRLHPIVPSKYLQPNWFAKIGLNVHRIWNSSCCHQPLKLVNKKLIF